MGDAPRLYTLKQVSKILNLNEEVLRRWLRSKRLLGIKIGNEWRIKENDLEAFLGSQDSLAVNTDNPQKMCCRFPMWLEFSGLPGLLNKQFGPQAWSIFKKLVELDFEHGKPKSRLVMLKLPELAERVGYHVELTTKLVKEFEKAGYLTLTHKKDENFFSIVSPIRTPKIVFDIEYFKGGIKGAPQEVLNNSCLRRFLESGNEQ